MSAARKRLACVECTRRKIRCDKVVPCRNCTRRGTTCTRVKENKHDSLVERLQARVQQLEATVQDLSERRLSVSPEDGVEVEIEADPDSEMGDAATILEFLAWGRRKNPDYCDDLSPGDVTAELEQDGGRGHGLGLGGDRASAEAYLRLLLPRRLLLERLVSFHCEGVLWYHNSFDAEKFHDELDTFYRVAQGQPGHPSVDPQWLALLFAVLTGALACAPRNLAQTWGFPSWEQTSLAQRWFKAVSTCLHHGDYTAAHSHYALQAIGTLTMSAHLLGFSNSLSVLIASAARIGQCLGLQRTRAPEGAWRQLCIQDWFSIPFFESYIISRPSRVDIDADETRNDAPSRSAYSHFFYRVATLLSSLHDGMKNATTLYTRYEQVLEHDRRLRMLATQGLPRFLQNIPVERDWPCYVPWARRCLAISLSHKVIMIHRKFLALSFTNPLFVRTRRTCVAAARTIIKEQKGIRQDGGGNGAPVLWIQQAFGVTASIILCLDLFHRPRTATDTEATHHRQLIHDGLEMLADGPSNMIAKRGVGLLEALLAREPRHASDLDLAGIIRGVCEQTASTASPGTMVTGRDSAEWPPGGEWSPSDEGEGGLGLGIDIGTRTGGGLEERETLEDILSLAANYI
ncbi:hypothetical protein BJX66DRAFT_134286 [Aspergillus keveii]|uniref:Zn(2)-C6 fungal-type domain-containing protein n=1 Tax=Aspergillus keveii TaxID=714993 RepID=A0ABR4GDK5_9EURO